MVQPEYQCARPADRARITRPTRVDWVPGPNVFVVSQSRFGEGLAIAPRAVTIAGSSARRPAPHLRPPRVSVTPRAWLRPSRRRALRGCGRRVASSNRCLIQKEFKRRSRSMETIGPDGLETLPAFTALRPEFGWMHASITASNLHLGLQEEARGEDRGTHEGIAELERRPNGSWLVCDAILRDPIGGRCGNNRHDHDGPVHRRRDHGATVALHHDMDGRVRACGVGNPRWVAGRAHPLGECGAFPPNHSVGCRELATKPHVRSIVTVPSTTRSDTPGRVRNANPDTIRTAWRIGVPVRAPHDTRRRT